MKLQSTIDAHAIQLGATPEGKTWCLKALHPASPLVECRGIPDESAVPSAFLNYQSSFTIAPAAGAVGTWQFDAALLPHPVNFMYYTKTDSVGTAVAECDNTQLTGATHMAKNTSFCTIASRWRLAYMSATVYQDGPALADQGTIAACQSPAKPAILCMASYNVAKNAAVAWAPIQVYDASDVPTFEYMQNVPNAYLNRSKEGLYLPLKLTRTHQSWKSQADLVGVGPAPLGGPTVSQGQMPTAQAPYAYFPHPNLNTSWYSDGASNGFNPTSPMCNDLMGFFSVRNAAVTTQFTVFIRAGYEIQCQPGSAYTTQLTLSPPFDPSALEAYFHIARELKDAYPSEYNDAGKIWQVIKNVISTLSPALGFIPGIGGALSAAAPLVVKAGDAIGELVRRSASKKTLATQSQAQIAQTSKAIQAAMSKPTQVSAPKGKRLDVVRRKDRK